jgi:hypothetical protein
LGIKRAILLGEAQKTSKALQLQGVQFRLGQELRPFKFAVVTRKCRVITSDPERKDQATDSPARRSGGQRLFEWSGRMLHFVPKPLCPEKDRFDLILSKLRSHPAVVTLRSNAKLLNAIFGGNFSG